MSSRSIAAGLLAFGNALTLPTLVPVSPGPTSLSHRLARRSTLVRVLVAVLIGMVALSAGPQLALAHGPVAGQSAPPPGQSVAQAARARAEQLTLGLAQLNVQYQVATGGRKARLERDLLATAITRERELLLLVEQDPGEVLRLALPGKVRASLPASVKQHIEEETDIEGTLEILHEDRYDGSRYHYSLQAAIGRLSLHFAADPPTHLLSGARVRVQGVRVQSLLALGGGGNVKTVAPAPVPSTLGAQRVLVILVNFEDNPTEPYAVADAQGTIFGTTSNFFLEGSYSQAWLTGDVVGWFTVALSSTVCDVTTLASQAQSAASAAGVNLSTYSHYVYAFPQNACGGLGLSTVGGNPSQSWINGTLALGVIAHELGHALGLWHSHALDCGTVTLGPTCTVFEYGNSFDAMGNTYPGHYNAFQKERLGWLNGPTAPPITTVVNEGTYTLETYESFGSGPKALKILKSTDPTTGQRTWYYVESRQAIGVDGFLVDNVNVLNGVLIHTGSESSGDSSFLLDMTPGSGILVFQDWLDPALVVGQGFYDSETGVTITTESVTGTQTAVTVRFDAAAMTAEAVTVSTDQASYTRGQSVSVTAKVRSGGSPVADATVTFAVTKSSGAVVTGNATTGPDGNAVYKVRLRKQDPVGLYQAGAVATKNGQFASGATTFTVR